MLCNILALYIFIPLTFIIEILTIFLIYIDNNMVLVPSWTCWLVSVLLRHTESIWRVRSTRRRRLPWRPVNQQADRRTTRWDVSSVMSRVPARTHMLPTSAVLNIRRWICYPTPSLLSFSLLIWREKRLASHILLVVKSFYNPDGSTLLNQLLYHLSPN